jgi:RNA polymerase sigma factor (sigma-70 family)
MDAKSSVDLFEAHRPHLRAVAYRILGSSGEADDAVQEAWLRYERTDTSVVENLRGWLTTVVARLCQDVLRARKTRREEPEGLDAVGELVATENDAADHELMMVDSVGPALQVVLETLAPPERVAFVLHDLFDMTFDDIAPIVARTPAATRQLASRGRRRVQGGQITKPANDPDQRRAVVNAFLAASREGNFSALLSLLDPDVVLRADAAVVRWGAEAEVRGPNGVAKTFSGRAQGARLALVDGMPAAVWEKGGRPLVIFAFTIARGLIVDLEMSAHAGRLSELDIVFLEDPRD